MAQGEHGTRPAHDARLLSAALIAPLATLLRDGNLPLGLARCAFAGLSQSVIPLVCDSWGAMV